MKTIEDIKNIIKSNRMWENNKGVDILDLAKSAKEILQWHNSELLADRKELLDELEKKIISEQSVQGFIHINAIKKKIKELREEKCLTAEN